MDSLSILCFSAHPHHRKNARIATSFHSCQCVKPGKLWLSPHWGFPGIYKSCFKIISFHRLLNDNAVKKLLILYYFLTFVSLTRLADLSMYFQKGSCIFCLNFTYCILVIRSIQIFNNRSKKFVKCFQSVSKPCMLFWPLRFISRVSIIVCFNMALLSIW